MFTLVVGGASSGKSAYAEAHTLTLDGPRVYLATMRPFGPEGQARVLAHRAQRRGKGFRTAERYTNLAALSLPPASNVLLECLGNLVANELFDPDGGGPGCALSGVEALLEQCRHLTVVTNEVFSGGMDYQGDTLAYLRELARTNRALAARADRVVEVVCGLPNVLKGGNAST